MPYPGDKNSACARHAGKRLVCAAVAALAALAGVVSMPGQASAAGTRTDDLVCNNMHTLSVPADESAKAAQIMAGTVDMGRYGTMKLAANPNWKPQATLDTAGDRYQNSLNWALPLLREGTRTGNDRAAAMTARFTALLKDWVADHPVKDRTTWINHPQYAGFRLGTFVCADRLLTSNGDKAWVATQIKIDLGVLLKGFTTKGANNTMLNGQIAAVAGAYQAGSGTQQQEAVGNVRTLRSSLVKSDGSDIEGAPGYGSYLSEILVRAARVLTAYDEDLEGEASRSVIDRQAAFLTQATRPDRQIESIGDGELKTIRTGIFSSSSTATWLATKGQIGTKPTTRYSTWQGGYVFGRSGWRAGNRDGLSSFYSLRTSTFAPLTAHRHLDTTALTFFSHGVSWFGDPGPYRYDSSALRKFITKRSAHSALVAPGTMSATAKGKLVRTSSTKVADKTCVQDTAYQTTSGVQLLRCVYYLRTIDALVVEDFVRTSGLPSSVTQQWVLSPMVTSTSVAEGTAGASLRLTGVTATGVHRTASMLTTGSATVGAAGANLGVFGTTYGKRADGSVISVPVATEAAGTTSSVLTVIAPREVNLSVSSATGASGRTITVKAGTATQKFVAAADGF